MRSREAAEQPEATGSQFGSVWAGGWEGGLWLNGLILGAAQRSMEIKCCIHKGGAGQELPSVVLLRM